MPTYIVTDPDTGRKVKLTGDSPPTEIELNNIFSNMPEPEPTIGDQAIGALESLATVATGAIAVPASGIAGLATSLLTGDPSAGEAVRKGVSDSLTFEGGEESKRQLGAIGGAVQSIDESLIRPAIAGTAGLVDVAINPISNITQGFEPAKTTVRSIREKGLGKSAGDQALDVTGSPLVASAIATAPTLIETAAGGLLGRITARNKISKTKAKTKESKRVLDDLESGVIKDSTVQDVTEIIKKGDVEDISAMIDADPEFFRALDELGVSSEPLASFSSRNPQFRDVEQALATVPGNILDPQAKTFISEISQIADNLIQQYGGTIDKAQLGLDFKADSIKNIDNLFEQADEAYSSLRGLIPERERFSVPSTVSFLEDLASKDKLPPKFASILKKLRPVQVKTKGKTGVNPATGQRFDTGTTETIQPKLGRIDLIRKEIGQAIGRGSGQFKDVETGLNKALYSRLTRDQDAIAKGVGGQALVTSDLGKSLVKQRKQVEDNLQLLLGKDLNSALNIKVSGAIKNLQKGEVDKFNEVMNAIPKNKREAIALSAMNDVFKGSGVNQQQLNPTQFVKWYQTINRSPSARKALFGALPEASRAAIDNLFTVSKGISTALGQKTPTGRINAMFNEDTGFIRKMVGKVVPIAVAVATKSPVASALTGSAVEQFMSQSTNGAKFAADLMGSPKFQIMVRQAVKEGVIEGSKASKKLIDAENKLSKSKVYQKWAEKIITDDRGALTGGVLGYLFGSQSNKEDTK